MRWLEFHRKSLRKPNRPRRLIIARIFSVPSSGGDFLKQLILFIIYFWPMIYFALTGHSLFQLN